MFTPSENTVRKVYATSTERAGGSEEEFDRWLAEHDAEKDAEIARLRNLIDRAYQAAVMVSGKEVARIIYEEMWQGRMKERDMSKKAKGTFEAVPMEKTTKDGRDVVYVSAPSLEQVESIRTAKQYDIEVGARIHALNAALQLRPTPRFVVGEEEPSPEAVQTAVLEAAQRFTDWLLDI